MAVPVGLLMIAGEFDLSIGSMVGVGSITIGIVTSYFQQPLIVAAGVAMVIAIMVGVVNGLLVTKTGLPSFIVTLGANLVMAGLALTVSRALVNTTQISVSTSGFLSTLYTARFGPFHVSLLWWLAIVAVAAWVLGRTRAGNAILATGGDPDRARRAGVMTARVKVSLYVCTALAATFVGVIQAVEFNTGDATVGQGYVFQVPIVVVIGGVLLTGGYGTIVGVVLGTIIYGIANAGLFYAGWNTDFAQVVIGLLMVIAVLTNDYLRRLALSANRPRKGR